MYFITGCSGLVGSYVARKLLAEGHKVKALKRTTSDLSLLQDIADQIDWVDGDILDVALLDKCINTGDKIIHAAAMVSFDPQDTMTLFKTNVEGTANIVNVCLGKDIKHFVLVSSVSSLGRKKGQIYIDETSKWNESSLNTNYARSKYLSELEVWRGITEGLPATIINPSVVLGVGDWQKSSLQLFKYVYDKKPFYALGSINCVDVRDIADVVFQLSSQQIIGERYILSTTGTSYKSFFDQIAKHFSINPPSKKVTPFIAGLAWRFAKLWHIVTGKKPLITKETAFLSQLTYYYKNDKICNKLDFKFRTLDETITWACKGILKMEN